MAWLLTVLTAGLHGVLMCSKMKEIEEVSESIADLHRFLQLDAIAVRDVPEGWFGG